MKGRDPDYGSNKYERLIISIRRASLDAFTTREPGKLRGYLEMLSNMVKMGREELVLEYWFPPLLPYPLKDGVVMGVACVTLIMSLRKGGYVRHL